MEKTPPQVSLEYFPYQRPIEKDSPDLTNPIIGIAGYKGAGKTLLATYIYHLFPAGPLAFIISMAGPLKKIARDMGWDGKKNRQGRKLLQLLGTECGRECIDPDIWVKLWKKQAISELEDGHVVICDDIRFLNEVEAIYELGGLMIRIDRPATDPPVQWQFSRVGFKFIKRFPFVQLRAERAHASEVRLPDGAFHYIFDNDDDSKESVEVFAKHIAKIIRERFYVPRNRS